jgi:hypothetical protein
VLINAFSSTSRAPPVSDEHAGRLDQEQISGATLDLSELLNQITDPYIKAIEEELRMNPTHWQKNKFEPPAHAESFTAAYFLQQSDKTLRLRDTIYEFQQKLESINFGNVPLVEQANAVLNHIVEQSTQTRQLIGVVSEHPLSITAEKAISQVIEDARKMQRTLNRAALAVAGGRGLSAELHNQLIVAVQTLVVSLGELDQQLRQISNDARMASLFLN